MPERSEPERAEADQESETVLRGRRSDLQQRGLATEIPRALDRDHIAAAREFSPIRTGSFHP